MTMIDNLKYHVNTKLVAVTFIGINQAFVYEGRSSYLKPTSELEGPGRRRPCGIASVMVVLARGPGCPSRHEPARSQGF